MNWIEILVRDIFAFFAFEFMDFVAKRTFIGATSNENQSTWTCRIEIIRLYEKAKPTLHFYRRRILIFLFVSAVFSFELVLSMTTNSGNSIYSKYYLKR